MPYKVTKRELAYYAGFFDGEGCIMIKKWHPKRPYHTLDVAITSTTLNILEDFKRVFGGTIHGAYKSKAHYKDKWNYNIGANKAMAMLKALFPYLKLKLREAKLGIEFQEREKYCKDDTLKADRLAKQEAQYILMKGLKQHNPVSLPSDGDYVGVACLYHQQVANLPIDGQMAGSRLYHR